MAGKGSGNMKNGTGRGGLASARRALERAESAFSSRRGEVIATSGVAGLFKDERLGALGRERARAESAYIEAVNSDMRRSAEQSGLSFDRGRTSNAQGVRGDYDVFTFSPTATHAGSRSYNMSYVTTGRDRGKYAVDTVVRGSYSSEKIKTEVFPTSKSAVSEIRKQIRKANRANRW